MAVVPPPWEELTPDEISKRLAAFSSLSSPTDVRCCYSPHAVYSTGSAVVDEMLPDGGLACGTVMEIIGPPAAGKSHLVRRMIAAFAARAALQWTPATRCCCKDKCDSKEDNEKEEDDNEEEEEMGINTCTPRDWCVFLVVSDSSSHSPHHLYELLKKAFLSAAARGVRCCSCSCFHHHNNNNDYTNPTGCLRLVLEKVKMVTFSSPNDLLIFFRYLSRVEFTADHHHRRRRRVLVVVDSLARLWEHPACGATVHARHWMAAELVREVRTAIAVGNGWRQPPCEIDRHRDLNTDDPIIIMMNNDNNNNNNNNNNGSGSSGGVAIVFVNGCKNMINSQTSTSRVVEKKPLGVPVWCAAAADVRLFVEPITAPDPSILYEKNYSEETETQSCKHNVHKMMKVSLVKGGGSISSSSSVVVVDKIAVV
ncbi:DNA repair protein [Trypanosoma theileri]|uniref:DNA repair protein n=1 Tax=Trypanosoma theileri TaxID=67003 RepID=A0A1X0P0X9_9TRYP|nr:DNA repair protein [Trypanosoma theileri]ORC90596.1 DNA repair protein [Trypanosoma theileri]